MSSLPTSFAIALRLAEDDPRAFHAYRRQLIERALSRPSGQDDLPRLQDRIDQLRAVAASPRCSLRAITDMLDDHLAALGGALSQWQSVLDTADADPVRTRHELARIDAMRARAEQLREEMAATLEGRPAG